VNARLRSALGAGLVVAVALVGSAEFFSYLYLRHVVRMDWWPAYLGAPAEQQPAGVWRIPHPVLGNWRAPNARTRHVGSCFAADLRSNSVGARDRERARDGANRTVVIGDSFVEAREVAEDERMTNVLEQRLGREFLNFGAATHGPLQYQLVYETLAAGFQHDHVLIMLLPDNDFTDNDYAFWRHKTATGGRARPYYEAAPEGGYRAFYPVPIRAGTAPPRRQPGVLQSIGDTIRRNSWTHRTVEYVVDLAKGRMDYSGYFDVTPEQFAPVAWTLGEFRRLAGERRITLAIIPRLNDFIRAGENGPGPLPDMLRERARALDIAVVDLLPPLRAAVDDPARLFFSCDGHWSALGNRLAAEALIAAGVLR
jgi:hypothetical protein